MQSLLSMIQKMTILARPRITTNVALGAAVNRIIIDESCNYQWNRAALSEHLRRSLCKFIILIHQQVTGRVNTMKA